MDSVFPDSRNGEKSTFGKCFEISNTICPLIVYFTWSFSCLKKNSVGTSVILKFQIFQNFVKRVLVKFFNILAKLKILFYGNVIVKIYIYPTTYVDQNSNFFKISLNFIVNLLTILHETYGKFVENYRTIIRNFHKKYFYF